jgi:hypothetical protein
VTERDKFLVEIGHDPNTVLIDGFNYLDTNAICRPGRARAFALARMNIDYGIAMAAVPSRLSMVLPACK